MMERDRSQGQLRWLVLLLPWAWFLIRPLHSSFEVVAVGMPLIALVVMLVALSILLIRRSLRSILWVVSLAAFFGVALFLPGRPLELAEPAETARLASVNVAREWFSYNDIGWLVETEGIDLFVASEISDSHDSELRERYGFGISDVIGSDPNPALSDIGLVDPTEVGPLGFREFDQPSIGVYSNFEIERMEDPLIGIVDGGLPGFRVRVSADTGDFILYALHIPKIGTGSGPYEVGVGEQRRLVQAIHDAAEQEDLPVVIAGDLNIVDRGESYELLTGTFDDAMRQSRWATPTRGRSLLHILLLLRIDHVLISPELCVSETPQALDVLYTDHSPLLADIGPCQLP